PYTVNVYQPMPSHVQNGHINNCFNISQDSRQCFDYCLVFPTYFGGFLHLASSMQLVVVVLMVLELVVELVLAFGPELVLEFAPVELGLSQLDLQSAPLGLQLVSAQVHVESVVVQLESAGSSCNPNHLAKPEVPTIFLPCFFCVPAVDTGFLFDPPTPLPLDSPAPLPIDPLAPPDPLAPLHIDPLAPPLDPATPPIPYLPLDPIEPPLVPLASSSLTGPL
ncbi:hypothetical protein Tco_1259360, partial [Tanacetum coccineum]